jgi:iron(III) transport system ATP-binding protein
MTMLAVTGLYKAFGRLPVLAGVDLDVPAGSLTAILGPSGSGKTTLLRVLAGFERADRGTVQIGGAMVDGPGAHVTPERRRIGYVPQEGSLFPHLTVRGNVAFGIPARERRGRRTADLLDAVGLAGLAGRYPHQLSGGQQQRVALARAMAIRPEVVLLDEPFASLDANMRASVRADVQRLLREAGTTAVLVTHDQDEALSIADRVAVLRDGKIAQCAPPHDLYVHPVDADLARFIGDANLIEGKLAGAADPGGPGGAEEGTVLVDTVFGRLPVAPGGQAAAAAPGAVTVLIRPEQLELQPPGSGGPGCLSGEVVSYGYHGHDAVVRVRPEHDSGTPVIMVRTVGGQHLAPGSPVMVRAHGPVITWPRD